MKVCEAVQYTWLRTVTLPSFRFECAKVHAGAVTVLAGTSMVCLPIVVGVNLR